MPRGSRFRSCTREDICCFFIGGGVLAMYQALYRKWRPKTFSEVVGQAHITDTRCGRWPRGRTGPRLSVHRHTGHRQDHLRQDSGQGGQLPASAWTATPAASARSAGASTTARMLDVVGDRRRQQQRRGQHPRRCGRRRFIPPPVLKIAGVYHRRGAHALHRRPSTRC